MFLSGYLSYFKWLLHIIITICMKRVLLIDMDEN